MMNKLSIFLTILVFSFLQHHIILGQRTFSPHKSQAESYRDLSVKKESDWNSVTGFHPVIGKRSTLSKDYNLKKTVFGWHPYWMGTTYEQYNYQLLTDIAYFSYEVDPNTGNYKDIHFWKTTELINLAHEAGTRVSLTVTLFDNHATFLTNTDARITLIDSLISLLQYRNAKGINIDFEGVPLSQKETLSEFIFQLSEKFHQEIPDAFLSMALPAVDWQEVFDVQVMKDAVDMFIVMGYNYYWSSSPVAGPVSPKNSGRLWSPYNVTASIIDYLQRGIPKEKLSLGVPYYGYDWKVENSGIGVSTTSRGDAVIYTTAVKNAQVYQSEWEEHASVPYYEYVKNDDIRQTWYDDEISLGFKYDLVNMLDIAGIGIWALGYDQNTTALWYALKEKFTVQGASPLDGNFSDLGGPEGNYFPKIPFDYKLPVVDNSNIQLLFRNIELKQGDTLKIYDGKGSLIHLLITKSPSHEIIRIKAPVTFEFIANSNESGKGWDMNWFCFSEDSLPYTLSKTFLNENMPENSQIGKVMVDDSNMTDNQFELTSGSGIYDNELFFTSDDKLLTSESFNYENQSAYFIRTKMQLTADSIEYRNFLITVIDKNDPPLVSSDAPSTIFLQEGESFDFCLDDIFYDEDEEDSLEFEFFLQNRQDFPNWISYDNNTLCLNGYAPDTVNLRLMVEAKDSAGGSVSSTLILQSDYYAKTNSITEDKIKVFPNPFHDKLVIDLSKTGMKGKVMIQVLDMTGRLVYAQQLDRIDEQLQINTTNYETGLYTVVLKSLISNHRLYFNVFRYY
jgi:spore germination protein YaaH